MRKLTFAIIAFGIILIAVGACLSLTAPQVGLIPLAVGLLLSIGSGLLTNLISEIFQKQGAGEFAKIIKDKEDEIRKIKTIMKVKNVSPLELIKHYKDPVNGVIILPYNQKLDKVELAKLGKKVSKSECRLIGKKLKQMGAIGLNGGFYFVPPKSFDQQVQTRSQLEAWINANLLNDLPSSFRYTLVLASIVDLKNVFAVQKKDKPEQWGQTIFDMIPPNQIFDKDFLLKEIKSKTSLKEVLDFAAPSIFGSEILSETDLRDVLENQNLIYKKIKQKVRAVPTTSTYANINSADLEEILSEYTNQASVLALHIISRAKEIEGLL